MPAKPGEHIGPATEFKKGRSGNPNGQIRDKIWWAALRKAVHEPDPDPLKRRKKLDKIAEVVVNAAMEGDMKAVEEIANRMDGKPRQAPEDPGGEDNPFNVAFRWAFEAVKAKGGAE